MSPKRTPLHDSSFGMVQLFHGSARISLNVSPNMFLLMMMHNLNMYRIAIGGVLLMHDLNNYRIAFGGVWGGVVWGEDLQKMWEGLYRRWGALQKMFGLKSPSNNLKPTLGGRGHSPTPSPTHPPTHPHTHTHTRKTFGF